MQEGLEQEAPKAGAALPAKKCMPLGNSKVARELSPSRVYRKVRSLLLKELQDKWVRWNCTKRLGVQEIDYHRIQVPPLFKGKQQLRILGATADGGRVSDASVAAQPPQLLEQVEVSTSLRSDSGLRPCNVLKGQYVPCRHCWPES